MLASVGSLGDVHPFVALGRALQARGHAVTLVCNDEHRDAAARAGLDAAPTGPAVDLGAASASPNLWHPIKGLGVFWKHMLAPAIAPTFHHIARIAADGPCLVVAPPVMFGARFARAACPGVTLVSAITAPAVLRTDRAPVTMAHWRLPAGTPGPLVRWAWRQLDRHKLHPMALQRLQREAAALGVAGPPAGSSVFGDWMWSPDGGLALFPPWFAPARRGWPADLRPGGFPLFDDPGGDAAAGGVGDDMAGSHGLVDADGDRAAGGALPPAAEAFLAAGPAPIVFMPGSAMRHAQAHFAAAVAACARLGERAVLLTPHAGQLPPELPPTVLHQPYLPFGALLPRARAVVHHGGIGSCAQGLRAGLPQLVMPMAHDQFDNAHCLRRLGVARILRPRQAEPAALARALRALLALPAAPRAAARARLLAEPALPGLCDTLSAWPARSTP